MKIKSIEKRFFVRVVSIILGIILWAIIIYIEDGNFDTTLKGIPITVTGEGTIISENLIVSNKGNLGEASISIRGKRSDVINAMDGIRAVVDVSKVSNPGKVTLKVSYELDTNAIYITERKTATVDVMVEKIQTKEFPLEVEQRGATPDSNVLIESHTEKDTITLMGTAKDIVKIKHVAAVVDIGGIVSNTEAMCPVKVFDEQWKEIKFTNSIYQEYEEVLVSNILHKRVNLPIVIEFNEEDKKKYAFEVETVSPKNIDVGLGDGMEISSLKALVDYNEMTKATEYDVAIEKQDGVYIPSGKEKITVKITANPLVEKYISVPLKVKSGENGKYTAPNEISILVRGSEKNIVPENIVAEADITAMKAGVHNVEVKVTLLKENLSVKNKQYVEIVVQ